MESGLMANGSDEADEQSGVVRLRVEFPKVDRYEFEKPKSKNFKEVADPRVGTTGGGRIRTVGVEERPAELVNIDKAPKTMNKASKEVNRAFEEAI
jgi:hypothetical protein